MAEPRGKPKPTANQVEGQMDKEAAREVPRSSSKHCARRSLAWKEKAAAKERAKATPKEERIERGDRRVSSGRRKGLAAEARIVGFRTENKKLLRSLATGKEKVKVRKTDSLARAE